MGSTQRYVNGSTQKAPLSRSIQFAVTPLVLTPFVPFRTPRDSASSCTGVLTSALLYNNNNNNNNTINNNKRK